MKIRQAERILIFLAAALLGFYLFNRFVYTPSKIQIGRMKKEQAALAQKINDAKSNTRLLVSQETNLEKLIVEFTASKEKLALGSERVTGVLAALADNANHYDIKINLIKPGQLESLPDVALKKLAIKVSFTGQYKNISDYLVSLEKLPARMILQELKLLRRENIAPEIEGEFTLVTLFEG